MLDQNPYPPYYVPQKRGAKDFFMMMFASMLGFIIASIAFSFFILWYYVTYLWIDSEL
jgi:hypothetical protein